MSEDRENISLDEVIESAKAETGEERLNAQRIQLVVFKLGGEEYALSLDQIKEVVITPNIARVPQTPEYIRGVANIRGNVIAIMDLELRFGLLKNLENAENSIANYTLVVESNELNVGILVKEVPNTLTILDTDIDYSANIIYESNIDEKLIKGIVKHQDRMVILVDIMSLVLTEEMGQVNETVGK